MTKSLSVDKRMTKDIIRFFVTIIREDRIAREQLDGIIKDIFGVKGFTGRLMRLRTPVAPATLSRELRGVSIENLYRIFVKDHSELALNEIFGEIFELRFEIHRITRIMRKRHNKGKDNPDKLGKALDECKDMYEAACDDIAELLNLPRFKSSKIGSRKYYKKKYSRVKSFHRYCKDGFDSYDDYGDIDSLISSYDLSYDDYDEEDYMPSQRRRRRNRNSVDDFLDDMVDDYDEYEDEDYDNDRIDMLADAIAALPSQIANAIGGRIKPTMAPRSNSNRSVINYNFNEPEEDESISTTGVDNLSDTIIKELRDINKRLDAQNIQIAEQTKVIDEIVDYINDDEIVEESDFTGSEFPDAPYVSGRINDDDTLNLDDILFGEMESASHPDNNGVVTESITEVKQVVITTPQESDVIQENPPESTVNVDPDDLSSPELVNRVNEGNDQAARSTKASSKKKK